MTVFSNLLADVQAIVNRPDRENLVKLGIRMATLKAHQSDFYPKDIYETGLEFQPADVSYIQSLDYNTVVPRWRSFKYLRKFDYTTPPGIPGELFTFIQPESVLDSYKLDKENVCYIAGDKLEIRSNTEDRYLLLGCYRHPDVQEATYSSWIANEHPGIIIAGAAAYVFQQTGYVEQANAQNAEVADQFILLRQQITGEGY